MDRPRVYGEAWRDCSEEEAGGREKAASGQAERTPGSDEGPGIMQVLRRTGNREGRCSEEGGCHGEHLCHRPCPFRAAAEGLLGLHPQRARVSESQPRVRCCHLNAFRTVTPGKSLTSLKTLGGLGHMRLVL